MNVASRGGTDELRGFRRLINATILATFVLILIGGIVRVSDSGLGCGPAGSGTHGWPLCEGGLLPAASAESVIEYTHRIVAALVGLMIVAVAWLAWRYHRDRPWIVRGAIAAGVLVLAQAILGGATVEEGLHEGLVAAHLGLAMLLLGLLLLLRRWASDPQPVEAEGTRGLRALAILAAGLILATIVAGGYVAGTEGEGTPNEPVLGAHMACGQQFPTCVDRFMPFGEDRLIDIQLTHRAFMYLTVIAVIALLIAAFRQNVRRREFAWLGALVLAQVLLGASNVWFGKHAGLIIGHLALGTIIWAWAVYVSTQIMAVSAPTEPARDERSAPGALPA
jgi:heme A synthase